MEIRPVTDGDVEAVVTLALDAWAPVFDSMAAVLGPMLFERLFGSDWRVHQEAAVRDALADLHAWVADDDGPVGFVAVDLPDGEDHAEIHMVAVAPAAQQRGIGGALTEHGIEVARAAGRRVLLVSTGGDPGHAPARATYERAGFTPFPQVQYWLALDDD